MGKPKSEKGRYRQPTPVTLEDILNSVPKRAGPAVVSKNEVDDVSLSSAVFKNINSRKSLTVHHLQRRLVELGYDIAGKDKDGWFGDNTLAGIISYQEHNKVGEKGKLDAETFLAIFEGDPNVRPDVQ
jgi:peptidoglycan hydrolase-like protein with peptidoglycan-binding domain